MGDRPGGTISGDSTTGDGVASAWRVRTDDDGRALGDPAVVAGCGIVVGR
jgi:hypothetical protein